MSSKLSLKEIKGIDKSDMLGKLSSFPSQLTAAERLAKDTKLLFKKRNFKRIVFAGVGGSAIGADLVKDYLSLECRIPIAVCRDYELPAYVDRDTLVFVSSYSGNTEEAISAYRKAQKCKCHILCVSSGGALKGYALERGNTFIQVPTGLPPRCALGYSSIIPLCIMARIGIIEDKTLQIKNAAAILEDLRDNCLKPEIGGEINIAKYAAVKLLRKFAVVYASSMHFGVAATRFRGQLNENAKSLALSHTFPEMNHNEIAGWRNPGELLKDFVVVMLKDKFTDPKVIKRMDITRVMLAKGGVRTLEIYSQGKELLSRIFSLIYTGDFISFYLAILYGIDPSPTEKIDLIKERIRN